MVRGNQGIKIKQARGLQVSLYTFSAVILTTLLSSVTTKSIHLRLGSFRRPICFFTIASKAMSGVNNPTLIPDIIKNFLIDVNFRKLVWSVLVSTHREYFG